MRAEREAVEKVFAAEVSASAKERARGTRGEFISESQSGRRVTQELFVEVKA